MYDLIIVGSGPAGLSAALSAKGIGVNSLVIERGTLADTIYHYPIARPLFSTGDEVELEPGFFPKGKKPTREEVLNHYIDTMLREQLKVKTEEEVRSVKKIGESFFVETSKDKYEARTALLAIGGFGRQRKLNVHGESPSRVSYGFTEAHPYALKRVLVVGGGNSAAEAALYLTKVGADVTLSIRRPSLNSTIDFDDIGENKGLVNSIISSPKPAPTAKIKPWVQEPLEIAAMQGLVKIITSSQLVEIRPRSAILQVKDEEGSKLEEVDCDHIFALIGADPDTHLLEKAGAAIAPDGRPIYDEQSYQTTVSGLYVAGHVTRALHMKNAIEVGRRVAEHIASQVLEASEVS